MWEEDKNCTICKILTPWFTCRVPPNLELNNKVLSN
jgi:hypothetical protein